MYIGKIAGIKLKLNKLFLLTLIFMGLLGLLVDSLVIFIVVIVHEIGHVLMAKKLDYTIESIELLPIGGVAHIYEGEYNKSSDEWFIAIAGPLNNLLFIILLILFPLTIPYRDTLIKYNLTLFVFNILPAFPLDGGRLLKAKLGKNRGIVEAKKLASLIGIILGIFLIGLSVFYYITGLEYIYLIVLGFFLTVSAIKEFKYSKFLPMRMGMVKEEQLIQILEGKILVCTLKVKVNDIMKYLETNRGLIICVIDDQGEIIDFITEKKILQTFTKGLGNITLKELLVEY